VIFAGDLCTKVLTGEKTVTRRAIRGETCRYRVGRTYAVQPGRGQRAVARIRVLDVSITDDFLHLSPGEVRREGFNSLSHFLGRWASLHGNFDPCWRIEFELA